MSETSSIPFAGKKVLVQGLGNFGGGVGVARWLAGQGAKVIITDMAPAEKLSDSMNALKDVPVEFKLGRHDLADFTACDLLVVNPAVDRANSPYLQAAIAAGIPITTEINLFVERCRGLTIGITGSIGKSTTTALIYHALAAGLTETGTHLVNSSSFLESSDTIAGKNKLDASPLSRKVFLGGNIGKSLLLELDQIRPQDVVVLELSSFMLDDMPRSRWSPNIAVVTNLVPNHLDRHGTMAAYEAAKQNILAFQKPTDIAVLNGDHPAVAKWTALTKGKTILFSTHGVPPLPLVMPGEHNQSNARAALAVLDALPFEINMAAALQAIEQFPGLAHRLQWVHTSQHQTAAGNAVQVRWFNDSKATTPEASITALQAFSPGTVICIVGGYDKKSDLTPFIDLLAKHAAGVLGIGQTGSAMIAAIKAACPTDIPRAEYAETLERAMTIARQWIGNMPAPQSSPQQSSIAVLLSPGCASWDQFQNYEQRGDLFTQLAMNG